MNKPLHFTYFIANQEQMELFAQRLLPILEEICEQQYLCLSLFGNLGTGKSTFSRSLIQSAGWTGNIPSPTYSIVEDYEVRNGNSIHHFDLYRLGDFSELEMIGFYDLLEPKQIFLVEWPKLLREQINTLLDINLYYSSELPDKLIAELPEAKLNNLDLTQATAESRVLVLTLHPEFLADYNLELTDLSSQLAQL